MLKRAMAVLAALVTFSGVGTYVAAQTLAQPVESRVLACSYVECSAIFAQKLTRVLF